MSSTMETVWEESGGVHCTFPACMCPYGSPDESLRNTPVSHVAPPLLSHDFTPQSVSWHDDRARASSPLPPPSLWPRLTKERVFFLREWHTVDSQMNQPNVTQLLQSWRCSRRYEEVRSRFLETDRVIFNYFILRTHWFNPAVILFPFNSSQPARHSWLQSGFFSWKDYRCVQLTTMHFGGNEHVEDNPKKRVSRWILWVKSSHFYSYCPKMSSLIPRQGQRDIQTNNRPTTQI